MAIDSNYIVSFTTHDMQFFQDCFLPVSVYPLTIYIEQQKHHHWTNLASADVFGRHISAWTSMSTSLSQRVGEKPLIEAILHCSSDMFDFLKIYEKNSRELSSNVKSEKWTVPPALVS